MSADIQDSLIKDDGTLEFVFTLLTPSVANEQLPNPPYILICSIEARPQGRGLLKRYAAEMITCIRAKLKSDRMVIFQPANGEIDDDEAQAKLEQYYLSCGFAYLPSSETKWWMTWPQNA